MDFEFDDDLLDADSWKTQAFREMVSGKLYVLGNWKIRAILNRLSSADLNIGR